MNAEIGVIEETGTDCQVKQRRDGEQCCDKVQPCDGMRQCGKAQQGNNRHDISSGKTPSNEFISRWVNPRNMENMRAMVSLYRNTRRADGPELATRAWVKNPLLHWLEMVDGAEPLCQCDIDKLVVACHETYAIRDALIASLVCHPSLVPSDVLLQLACRPMEQKSSGIMCDILSRSFKQRCFQLDRRRAARGIEAVSTWIELYPETFQVQLWVICAYCSWWMQEPYALQYAQKALEIDSSCTLANIVVTALERKLFPVWTHNRE